MTDTPNEIQIPLKTTIGTAKYLHQHWRCTRNQAKHEESRYILPLRSGNTFPSSPVQLNVIESSIDVSPEKSEDNLRKFVARNFHQVSLHCSVR